MRDFWGECDAHFLGFAHIWVCLSVTVQEKVDRAASDVGKERMQVGGAFDNVQITKIILMTILDGG